MLYPLLWMLASSFKPDDEIFGNASLWPETFTIDAYIRGWIGLDRQLRDVLLELVRHLGPQRDRQRDLLLAGGLCLRAA